MSKKISQLPPATQGNATDLLEKSDQGGAPSQKLTLAQLLAFIQANATAFTQSNVNFSGSVTAASTFFGINADGSFGAVPGGVVGTLFNLLANGSVTIGNSKIQLNADGSATFASANLGISADGTLDVAGAVQLLPTGAAFFANGGASFDASGAIVFASASTGGDIEITDTTKGVILRSPNGTRYRLKVDNAGNLGSVLVP